MDALVPTFIAALLAEIGDKTMLLAALLGARYRAPATVIAGIAAAALANALLASAGGVLVAQTIGFRAVTLLLALALGSAGIGAIMRQKPPALSSMNAGAFATSAFSFFVLEFGDKTQFLTMALAARAHSIGLAAAGATAAVVLTATVAVLSGPAVFERLPTRRARIAVGMIFLLLAAVAAIDALRLA